MTSQKIDVTTPRGTMPVHLRLPDGVGRCPLVVLFMDAAGIRPALHGHAERLVRAGYMTALPDLYYDLDPDQHPRPERLPDPEEFDRMGRAVSTLEDEQVIEDTAKMLARIDGRDQPWGCVGFCAGGRFGLRAAHRFGSDLAAAALLHPARLVTDEPDSPHRHVDRVRASLYLGFGERDHVTPPSTIPPLREQLERHGVPHRIEIIPEADHGFTMPGSPAYDEQAAERAWTGSLQVLGDRLAD